jgi:predicted NBD/HSP70 family sugar kinase
LTVARSTNPEPATSPAPQISGANQSGVRAHNERVILSLLRRHGALSKAEIARLTGLSAQTISVINRQLETDGLVMRAERVRGRVGQPSTPMTLNPDGVFSIGLRIGRRSADLALMDFTGIVRRQIRTTHAFPTPDSIMAFLADSLPALLGMLEPALRDRVIGIGVASPFELWHWLDRVGAPSAEMQQWRGFDLVAAARAQTGLDVMLVNDASSACLAELTVGDGRETGDFAYFFVGFFIGGGIVLNHALQTGATGNAGAFGPLPSRDPRRGNGSQLIDTASLFTLERSLIGAGVDPADLWRQSGNWDRFEPHLTRWLAETAQSMADAIVTVCAVFDFPVIIVDGAFPDAVRADLTARINAAIENCNTDGIQVPDIISGSVGSNARVIGASMLPISARFLVDRAGAAA